MSITRLVCLSDPHACFDLLRNLLEKVFRFNPATDYLLVLGDVLDRGPDALECVLYLSDLRSKYPDRVKLLMGNHEYTAWNSLTPGTGTIEDMRTPLNWITSYGGEQTIKSFGSVDNAKEILLPYIESLDYFYETPDFIFVHGGIPRGTKNIKEEVPVLELLNNRAMDYDGPHKTVICGHTVVDRVKLVGKHVIAIDTGAVFYGKLSAYDCLNRQVYWIEDRVPSPYYVGRG